MMKYAPTNIDAIVSLVGGSMTSKADGSIVFFDGQTPPSDSEVNTKLAEMQAEYDAQEYARNRQLEYPTVQELVVALYDEDDKAAIEAKRAEIKAKYPKP